MFNWLSHLKRTSKAATSKRSKSKKSAPQSAQPIVSNVIDSSIPQFISDDNCMKYLIVGLGNPGAEYANTRHNIGFDSLDSLAASEKLVWEDVRHGKMATMRVKGKTLLLLKPSTFMNLSGKALNYWMQQEKIPVENVLVVVDDLALDLGVLRIKPKGSDAGHNGLKNIHEVLGHNNYARLRFGIGCNFSKGRQVDFVLGKWSTAEASVLIERIPVSVEMIKSFVSIGLQLTMTAFNNK